MSKTSSFEKYQKRRLRSSYLSVVVSIALVLFLLGLLGLLIFHTKSISNHFKEKYAINIFLKNATKEKDIKNIKAILKKKKYTKALKFISKEQALEIYKKDVGEDFMEFLGDNPLKSSFDLYLKADFLSADKMQKIKKEILSNKIVDEVTYDKNLISLLNESVKKISFWLFIFSALLSSIAIVLINSYLRLAIYSKRFIIKTMQMVGATKRFIRKPFLYRSVKLGMLGAVVAILALSLLLLYLNNRYPDLGFIEDKLSIVKLFFGVFIAGIIITWLSTYFGTNRFLNLTTDELHY